MGDLLRTSPHTETNAFLERLAAMGVTRTDMKALRAYPLETERLGWIAKVLKSDDMIWEILEFGMNLKTLGVSFEQLKRARANPGKMANIQAILTGSLAVPHQHD